MEAVRTFLRVGLHLAVFTGVLGQSVHFDKGVKFDTVCGGQPTEWSSDGSVTLIPGQKRFFKPIAVVEATKDLCTIDLTRCPPDVLPTSPQSCYCKGKRGNTYDIHVGVEATDQHAGMTVQAMVQGNGVFNHMMAAASIGKLPSKIEDRQSLKVYYSVNGEVQSRLRAGQHAYVIKVCPEKKFLLEVCTENGGPEARLNLKAGDQVISSAGRCVLQKFDPVHDIIVDFVYRDHKRCNQDHRFFITENVDACPETAQGETQTPNQSETTTSPETITDSDSLSTSATGTQQIRGICPDTPRSVRKLASGVKYLTDDTSFPASWTMFGILTDEVSHGASWIVFQRRTTGDKGFDWSWDSYVIGFGGDSPANDYWLGLENIHRMCNKTHRCELLINLMYDKEPLMEPMRHDACYYARYSEFWLSGYDDNYRLTVSGYTGTAGDSLVDTVRDGTNADQMFSTWDHNDWLDGNCALTERNPVGWWFNHDCSWSNLNGVWGSSDFPLVWFTLTGMGNSVSFSEMKLRSLTVKV